MLILTDAEPRDLGYFELDHRACDAPLPEGIPRHLETHTYTCSHCCSVVVLNALRKRERYKCKSCDHHICDNCAAELFEGAACKTFWQKAEEIMERAVRQPNSTIILP